MNKTKKHLSIIILALVIIVAGSYLYYNSSLKPIDVSSKDEVVLNIEEGTSGNRIGSMLKEHGLIKNEKIFKLYLKLNKVNDLKSGEYRFNRSMDTAELVSKLRDGGKNTNISSFTIPEGYELKQIAKKLDDENLVDEEIFLEKVSDKKNYEDKFEFLKRLDDGQSLEGYLFPSTYEVAKGANEDEVIETMLREFVEVYKDNIEKYETNTDLEFNEIVTLASIIERESKRDDEREMISAVFQNRLKEDMRLQSCATVQYILGERKEVLSNADTKIESEFNTYLYSGLPPTPISSVGKESLLAAVKPADVDYLYFRTKDDGTGGHTFSRTYEEHLKAKPNK